MLSRVLALALGLWQRPEVVQVRCRHCGAANEAQPVSGGAVTVVCDQCGRPFTVDTDAAPAPPASEASGGRALLGAPPPSFGALGRPGGFDPGLGAPAPGPDFGSLAGDLEPDDGPATREDELGPMPTGGERFDLSSILDPLPTPASDEPLGGGNFTFGDDAEAPTRLDADFHEDESTRVVDLDATAKATMGPAAWRVRSDRGLVYDLQSLDAVVAWLEGKTDISQVRLARGESEFLPIDGWPEVSQRLGPRAAPIAGGSDELALDTARAPAKRPPRAQQPQRAPELRRSGPREGAAAGAKKDARLPENPLGFGFVLLLLAGGSLLAAGVVVGGVLGGWMGLPPALASSAQAPPAPVSARLARAIELFEDEQYTAATRLLQTVADQEDDPRALRYLAMALHRSNRQAEARAALEAYRARNQRTNGNDGRQVREMRH